MGGGGAAPGCSAGAEFPPGCAYPTAPGEVATFPFEHPATITNGAIHNHLSIDRFLAMDLSTASATRITCCAPTNGSQTVQK